MAQAVERLSLAQVILSWSVGSGPTWGSELTAQNLEAASDSVSLSLSLSLCPSPTCALSLPLSKINSKKMFLNKKRNN